MDRTVEGPDATAACTCGACSVTTPPSCGSGDASCTKGANAIPTGQCVTITTDASYKGYEFADGTVRKPSCQAGAPGAAEAVALASESTVCCGQ